MSKEFMHSTVRANGQRIHVVEAGEGPMVLMVHGFPESWYSWRHQLHALAEAGYHAVAVDQRGYGRSSKPSRIDDYRITELVADMAGVVNALGERTSVIVGHDWGSMVSWTAAWTRPDVFRAVMNMSVPFGGRGLLCLPGSPFGEMRPSDVERHIAGAGKLFYTEYFKNAPGNAEREFERDVRGWMEGILYSMSASLPGSEAIAEMDVSGMTDDELALFVRSTPICFPAGTEMRSALTPIPEGLTLDWCGPDDINYYVEEFERSGFTGPLNFYRCIELNWELLAPYEGKPIQVPAQFITGDRDLSAIWGRTALAQFPKHAPLARPIRIVKGSGHWVQQEKPTETTALLLEFLAGL